MSTITKYYKEWMVLDRYLCSVRLLPTPLGNWKWEFMDMTTGNSDGGWVSTSEHAYAQCEAMLKNAQEDNK